MNQLSKILILSSLSFVMSKSLIPDNGAAVILEKDKKEYIYYKFNKEGIAYSNIDKSFAEEDSVRIKFFIR